MRKGEYTGYLFFFLLIPLAAILAAILFPIVCRLLRH